MDASHQGFLHSSGQSIDSDFSGKPALIRPVYIAGAVRTPIGRARAGRGAFLFKLSVLALLWPLC